MAPGPSPRAVVGIGSSAGGLDAFSRLLRGLRADTGMAFVLVQHLDPHHQSALAELLSSCTSMPVAQAAEGIIVRPNQVYVLPSGQSMTIADGMLRLAPLGPAGERRNLIDTFLCSLAADQKTNSIGVALSGAGSDGTLGLEAIKAAGGITFAQDASAAFGGMPRSAIQQGAADFVLPPEKIAAELANLAGRRTRPSGDRPLEEQASVQPPVLRRIVSTVHRLTGFDASMYKPALLEARILRRVELSGTADPEQYLRLLSKNRAEADALVADLLSNDAGFFRDPAAFDVLQANVLPAALDDRLRGGAIRVWVPGCSTGEEVYSIAIALAEYLQDAGKTEVVRIFGTDRSENVIARARSGIYSEAALAAVSPERRGRYFAKIEAGYQISRRIREMCIFSVHDVSKDPPLSGMDLLCCRTLPGWLAPEVEKRVLNILLYTLRPGGCLWLDGAEPSEPLSDAFVSLEVAGGAYRRNPDRPRPADLWSVLPPFNLTNEGLNLLAAPAPVGAAQVEEPDAPLPKPSPTPLTLEQACIRIAELEDVVTSTGRSLRRNIEELRSANEEVQSANEELLSTNEELQTAKEELLSANEELTTFNAEMEGRNAELVQTNNDLVNLLSSLNIPIVMLDDDLRIRRFTSVSRKVLSVQESDVGRPISDLQPGIDAPDLVETLRKVIDTPIPHDQEVRDRDGRWYSMRVRPYRTAENQIRGAVLQLLDIDQIKQGVEEIRRARDYAEGIIDTVRVPLAVLRPDLRIDTVNRAFRETFRLSQQECCGSSIFEVRQGLWDSARLHRLLEDVAAGAPWREGFEVDDEIEGLGRKAMLLSARRIERNGREGAILLAFEDITEHKRAAEARYRRLFESAMDGILIADGDGVIREVNPFLEQLFGHPRAEVVGLKLWEVDPLLAVPESRQWPARIAEQGVLRFPELSLTTRDGREVQVEAIANAYLEGDRRMIQFNVRDITERKRFERRLEHAQKLESLGLLAGGIAHDFNNLLTGILGNAGLALEDSAPDDPIRAMLRRIITAGERAADLTRQMLAYSGKGRFVTEQIDVNHLLAEIAELVRSSLPKMVEVVMDLKQDLPQMEGDLGQIQQLVMNLVINGGEAIPEGRPGSVTVRTRSRRFTGEQLGEYVEGEVLEAGNYIVLEVIDTGAGMDDATKSRIFDPFFTTKFTGRGLGLAAALGIVRAHRGAIRVRSQPGSGTTFEVLLPASATAPVKRNKAAGTRPAGRGGVVLVVDDEETVRVLAKTALERNGYKVILADNGAEAVRIFGQKHDRISAVILDRMMPVMGGSEALPLLQAINPEVPILLSSGYEEIETMEHVSQGRPAGFVQKPYSIEALLEAVRSAPAARKRGGAG